MYIHNIDPILLRIGFLEIRYYGLSYVLGIIVIYFMLNYLAKRKQLNISKENISDLLLYSIIGMLIGARLFYVFAYNINFYLSSPLKIFALWEGGMSFHGALLGVIFSGFLFCRKKKIDFYTLADILVIPLTLALMLGRIANFINGELYGRITSVPWAVKFRDAEGFRHPSQIYEAMKNLFMFFVLWSLKDKKMPNGIMFWLFISMYGSFRFLIEFFREPDVQIGFIFEYLTLGQVFSLIMALVGWFMVYNITRKKKDKMVDNNGSGINSN